MESKWLALGLPVAAAGAASLLVLFTVAKATSADPIPAAGPPDPAALVPEGVCTENAPAQVQPCAAAAPTADENVCPISGESGPSSLSMDEVLERVHENDEHMRSGGESCPYAQDQTACPSADEPADKKAIWL